MEKQPLQMFTNLLLGVLLSSVIGGLGALIGFYLARVFRVRGKVGMFLLLFVTIMILLSLKDMILYGTPFH